MSDVAFDRPGLLFILLVLTSAFPRVSFFSQFRMFMMQGRYALCLRAWKRCHGAQTHSCSDARIECIGRSCCCFPGMHAHGRVESHCSILYARHTNFERDTSKPRMERAYPHLRVQIVIVDIVTEVANFLFLFQVSWEFRHTHTAPSDPLSERQRRRQTENKSWGWRKRARERAGQGWSERASGCKCSEKQQAQSRGLLRVHKVASLTLVGQRSGNSTSWRCFPRSERRVRVLFVFLGLCPSTGDFVEGTAFFLNCVFRGFRHMGQFSLITCF